MTKTESTALADRLRAAIDGDTRNYINLSFERGAFRDFENDLRRLEAVDAKWDSCINGKDGWRELLRKQSEEYIAEIQQQQARIIYLQKRD